MLSSLILQLMIDVLLVGVVAWLWLQQKKHPVAIAGGASLGELAKKISEYDQVFSELRASLETERRKTQALHDRIQNLIEQGALTSTIFPMSQEEEELKAVSAPLSKVEVIPTLRQMEITRERVSNDLVVDLRTILRDQLA